MHINRDGDNSVTGIVDRHSPVGKESKFETPIPPISPIFFFFFSTSTLRSPLFSPLPGTVFRVAGTVTKGSTRQGEVLKFQHGPTRGNEV